MAIGGLADHVHLAVMFPATVTFAEFMKQIKGVSSAMIQTKLTGSEGFFKWQEGYGVFASHTNLIPKVVRYIETQEERHAKDSLWSNLEETDEEVSQEP